MATKTPASHVEGRLLTIDAAAEILSISPRTLRTLIALGRLATIRVSPRRLAIHPDDLASYVRARRQGEVA